MVYKIMASKRRVSKRGAGLKSMSKVFVFSFVIAIMFSVLNVAALGSSGPYKSMSNSSYQSKRSIYKSNAKVSFYVIEPKIIERSSHVQTLSPKITGYGVVSDNQVLKTKSSKDKSLKNHTTYVANSKMLFGFFIIVLFLANILIIFRIYKRLKL